MHDYRLDADSGIRADSSYRRVDGSVCHGPGGVSVCFQDKCGGPAVSEEYSPGFLFAGGGGRLLIHTPWLSLSQIQREYLPCLLPVVSSWPFFLGKVAFDVAGLGVGPPCLRVDSEETLLTVIDKRAQLAHAAPGVTPVDSSEEGAPVRELIQLSVLGEPLVNSLQESMAAEERLEYSIQATAIVWQPLEQMRCVVSDDVNSDSFGMAPWDAGGMHGNDCECRETFRTMMLQWLIWLLCRPVIRNGLGRTTRMIMEYGLDQFMMTNMDSPRLAVAPGEWYASDMLMPLSRDLHQMYGIPEVMGAIYDCRTTWDFHRFDFTAADHSAVELDKLTFRRRSFLPEEFSARGDTCDVVMLDDLILRHIMSFPPDELSAGRDGIYMTDCDTVWCSPHMNSTVADCGAVALMFRRTKLPPDEFSAGRNGNYIWRDLWTGPSICNGSVTGSLPFASSHRLVRCCLWLADLPIRLIGSAEVTLRHHSHTFPLSSVSSSPWRRRN